MQQFKLANILLEDGWQFYREPALYCVSDAPLAPAQDQGSWTLGARGSFDFTTFFNALSVSKWKRYTVAKEFYLHLELYGSKCVFTQTRADSFSWYAEKVEGTERALDCSDAWQAIDIPLVLGPDTLVGFMIETEGDIQIRNGYYYTHVEEHDIRQVELALCTTTFKKEEFVLPNIELVKKRVLNSDEPVARHFNMHVVDNGRTLDIAAIADERVHVHPNPNAGGAGGFARGMIESMEQTPKATHVLLMDDDVKISPESIIRTYNLLALVNDDYKEAFLSGAMMNMDEPEVRHEDIGYVSSEGKYFPAKPWMRMNILHDVVLNEDFHLPYDSPFDQDKATQAYAAWWYCVIPMTVIERIGMPLPVFVRCDDVEYNLRAHAKLMTMNGICVWHSPFGMRYTAAVERYQMPRNVMIGQFTTGMAPMTDFVGQIKRDVELELKKYNYTNAELILDGFEDFLKGPGFIAQSGAAETSYLAALKKAEKLVPLAELKEQAAALGVNLDEVMYLDMKYEDDHRSPIQKAIDFASVNGQRFVGTAYDESGKIAIIDFVGWAYPIHDLRGCEYIIAIDAPNRKGVIRKADKERFKEVWKRYQNDMREFRINKNRLREEYAAAREVLTSVDYWKNYLGM